MHQARSGAISASLSDRWILVAGGEGADFRATSSAEVLDLHHLDWDEVSPMHQARAEAAAVTLADGRVLVTGGAASCHTCRDGWTGLQSAEVFDPYHARWREVASMHHARYGHQALLLPNGDVFVGAGSSNDAEIYDPRSDAWSSVAQAPSDLAGGGIALLPDGRVLGVSASSSGPSHAEIYDSASETWAAAPSMPAGHAEPTLTVLRSGGVLVTGAASDGSPHAALYDPVQKEWVALDPPPEARSGGVATLLDDGRVLIVGGSSSTGDLAPAALFDPRTGHWSLTPPLDPAPGIDPVVQPLPDGEALVAGGGASNPSGSNGVSSAVQLFQP